MTINDLEIGELAIIEHVPETIDLHLLELGFINGVKIKVIKKTQLNLIYLIVDNSYLVVVKEDINEIKVKLT